MMICSTLIPGMPASTVPVLVRSASSRPRTSEAAAAAFFLCNAAIFSQTGGSVGIGFAIPVNIAKDVLPQLREKGRVTRGYLGVAVAPVTPDARRELHLPPDRGALIAEVVPRSPAATSGLAAGDVVTAFQNAPVQSPNELTRRVGGTPPGTRVTLTVARPGGERTISTTLAQLRDEPTSEDR